MCLISAYFIFLFPAAKLAAAVFLRSEFQIGKIL